MLLRVALGVVLLSDVSTEPAYTEVYQSPVLVAGLSPINTNLTTSFNFNEFAITEFWFVYRTIFSDTKSVTAVDPLNCASRDTCSSYFMPGTPEKLVSDQSQPSITTDNFTQAVSFIQHDAPGFQIDFFPVDLDDPPISLQGDCKLYGVSNIAIQICLKAVNNAFVAGKPAPSCCFTDASMERLPADNDGRVCMFEHDRLAAKRSREYENGHHTASSDNGFRSLQPNDYRHSGHL